MSEIEKIIKENYFNTLNMKKYSFDDSEKYVSSAKMKRNMQRAQGVRRDINHDALDPDLPFSHANGTDGGIHQFEPGSWQAVALEAKRQAEQMAKALAEEAKRKEEEAKKAAEVAKSDWRIRKEAREKAEQEAAEKVVHDTFLAIPEG